MTVVVEGRNSQGVNKTIELTRNGKQKSTTLAEAAAVEGDGLHLWANDITPGAADIVLTNIGLYYNVPAGRQVIITGFSVYLGTVSDDCHFNLVSCTAVAGGGAATDISCHQHITTGAAIAGFLSHKFVFTTPIRIRYSDGARSISMRVHANDAAAEITVSWGGFVMDEQ